MVLGGVAARAVGACVDECPKRMVVMCAVHSSCAADVEQCFMFVTSRDADGTFVSTVYGSANPFCVSSERAACAYMVARG